MPEANGMNSRKSESPGEKPSSQLYRAIFNSTNDAITVVNVDNFTIAAANAAFLEQHQLTEADVIGKTCFQVTHHRSQPCTPPDDVCPLLDTTATGEHSVAEHVHYTDNDEKVFVEVSTTPLNIEDGRIRQVIHITRNITAQKQAEELFRNLALSSPVGVYIVQDRVFQYVNPAFRQYTGYSEKELLGMESLNIVHPEDRAAVRENAIKMLKGQSAQPYGYRSINKHGDVRWVLETVASTEYMGKQASIGTYVDITEQKQIEKALTESEQNFRNSMDNSPLGIVIHGERKPPPDEERSEIIYANQAVLDIFGLDTIEELNAASLSERYTSQSIGEIAERMRQKDSGASMPPYYEVDIKRKGGGTRHLEVSTEEVLWDGENRTQLIYQDITQRKMAEEAREKLIKELREALDNVNTLRGLLPICAWCKKMRDDTGYWKSVEDYISGHTGAEFTHGICPECQQKLFNEIEKGKSVE